MPRRISDPVACLFASGHLQRRHVTAAMEIRHIAERHARAPRICGDAIPCRDQAANSKVEVRSDKRIDSAAHLIGWAKAIRSEYGTQAGNVVAELLLNHVSIEQIRKKYRIGWRKASKMLRDALEVWRPVA